MRSFRGFIGLAVLSIAACAGLGALSACGTGTSALDPGTGASTPATSHFKADLATGYDAIAAVRVAASSALEAHAITVDQGVAVQTQCTAFTATLDSLRTIGETASSQTALMATLMAIKAATNLVATTQGVSR